jgi:hypothetical protein
MGIVINFPLERAGGRPRRESEAAGSATVVILPVIRIERYTEEPVSGRKAQAGSGPRRGRRRRATRS